MDDLLTAPWEPLAPSEASALLHETGIAWWIAGGWAIDLYVGHETRSHADIDVGVLRRDQTRVHEILNAWELWAADPPGELRPWEAGEQLPVGVHDIWCRLPGGPWSLQLMLNESDGDRWVNRRDPSLSVAFSDVLCAADSETPFLAPEVQLLFKAKHHRPKDDGDFEATWPLMPETRRQWLQRELPRAHPGHPWLAVMNPA